MELSLNNWIITNVREVYMKKHDEDETISLGINNMNTCGEWRRL